MHVLVVDDHPLFRQGMKALLQGLEPQVAVTEAGSVREALGRAQGAARIDLVLLDMSLPDCSRLAALEAVKAAFEEVPVVVVSADEDPSLVRAAIEAGASGYVPKSSDSALTVNALRIVLAHGVYLPPNVLCMAPPAGSAPAAPVFSARQGEVLAGLLRGQSNKVIARELGIAEGTVKAHLWAIYQVLGVTTRTMAMYRAFELGLIDGNTPGAAPPAGPRR